MWFYLLATVTHWLSFHRQPILSRWWQCKLWQQGFGQERWQEEGSVLTHPAPPPAGLWALSLLSGLWRDFPTGPSGHCPDCCLCHSALPTLRFAPLCPGSTWGKSHILLLLSSVRVEVTEPPCLFMVHLPRGQDSSPSLAASLFLCPSSTASPSLARGKPISWVCFFQTLASLVL